ncbi:MAG: hypothetical protein P9M11_08615 [Candidatus Tenebribacter burtonii]|jgi:hypothetical protein|nr:hypothetical protein [Candidatus Tenebribacter burtonii]
MEKLDNYDFSDFPKIDCLILAGGSDFRAYEVLKKLELKSIQIKEVVLIDFQERTSGGKKKVIDSYNIYKKINYKIVKIPGLLQNPSECIKSFISYGIDFSKYEKIGIDISCFTKPYFFLIIKLIKSSFLHSMIFTFYTEPESYLFPNGLFNLYQSSYGPLSVIEIPGFTGIELREQNRILVILLGFDGDLSKEINFDVSPIKSHIVNGFPGYSPKFKDISLVSNEKLIQRKESHILYCRANNPFETYNLLESLKKNIDQKNEDESFFLNIAPLGPKPMALGACLFAIHNPEVRIIYPLPQNYKKITTDKCSCSWLYEIPLIL